MNMRKTGDALPTPNHRMEMGIHAMGEIGRSIWNSGFRVIYAPLTQPIHKPKGTAKITAREKPQITRNSDAPICAHRVPF
jgi:hypothetical protein